MSVCKCLEEKIYNIHLKESNLHVWCNLRICRSPVLRRANKKIIYIIKDARLFQKPNVRFIFYHFELEMTTHVHVYVLRGYFFICNSSN